MTHEPATTNEDERRQFWRQMMDEAYAFMMRVREFPIAECGEPVVSLKELASKAKALVLFSDTPFAAPHRRLFFLRTGLAESFIAVARAMNARNWAVKVEDAYRTRAMQTALALSPSVLARVLERTRWECGDQHLSSERLLRRLTVLVATLPKIATHMSASAIDVSVVDMNTGHEVDRGGAYLEMSETTPMHSPFISRLAQSNRHEISSIMHQHGFAAYPYEFWHYSQGDAIAAILDGTQAVARYGAVDVETRSGRTHPIDNPEHWLVTTERLQSILEHLQDQTR